MKESNKQLAMNWLKAVGSGDVKTIKALTSEDGQWQLMGTSVLAGIRSLDEVCEIAERLFGTTRNGVELNFVALTAEEDRVAVEMEGSADLADGGSYNNVYHILFYIRDGRVHRVREYADSKIVDALAAKMAAATQP